MRAIDITALISTAIEMRDKDDDLMGCITHLRQAIDEYASLEADDILTQTLLDHKYHSDPDPFVYGNIDSLYDVAALSQSSDAGDLCFCGKLSAIWYYDEIRSWECFKRAADLGHAVACGKHGHHLIICEEVPKAVIYFHKGVCLGDAYSMYMLGCYYIHGNQSANIEQNIPRGRKLLENAKQLGFDID